MYPTIPIDGIVSGYKESMDFLALATSRTVTVVTSPFKSGCLNHSGFDPITKRALPFYNTGNPFSTGITVIPSFGFSGVLNIPFSGGVECPVCNGNGFLNCPSSGTVSARIQWRNQDTKFDLDREKLRFENFQVRIKVTGSQAISLLDRAEKVVIDGENCKIIKEKVPVGLRDIHTYYYFLNRLQ
jgi:hypothetical protein